MEALKAFYREHCIYLPAMAGWFLFSTLLSSYNKKVFGQGHMAFPCPLLLTSIHFLLQWIFSWGITALFPSYFGGDYVASMDWKPFLLISIPCGFITSADVGMSNLALVRISITFYTMIKASTPIFVLAWAYLFGIERITWMLLLVVLIIAMGEFLTVIGETEFDLIGFCECLSAAILSGARWTLVQLKIQSLEPPLKTTLATMRVLSPSMFFSMLIISIAVEKPWTKLYFDNAEEVLFSLGLGVLGAVFAIAMILCEFSLIMEANAIILMIGGVIKEMITIIVGVHFFHDSLNRINIWGCVTVFLGVILYKVQFHYTRNISKEQSSPLSPLKEPTSRYDNINDHSSDDEDEDFKDEDIDELLDALNGDNDLAPTQVEIELAKTAVSSKGEGESLLTNGESRNVV